MKQKSHVYEVIVVGAGIGGLSAGVNLKEQTNNFLILEANDRIGGRIFTKKFHDGSYVQFGGSFIGPTQHNMYRLVQKYQLQIEHNPHMLGGKGIVAFQKSGFQKKLMAEKIITFSLIALYGVSRVLSSLFNIINEMVADTLMIIVLLFVLKSLLANNKDQSPEIDEKEFSEYQEDALGDEEKSDFNSCTSAFKRLSDSVNVRNPSLSPNANKFDKITLKDWIFNNFKYDRSRDLFLAQCLYCFDLEPEKISFLDALAVSRSTISFDMMYHANKGGRMHQFTGGSSMLIEAMAEDVGLDKILTSCPVQAVYEEKEDIFSVETARGMLLTKKIIIAVPPKAVLNIQFNTPLPYQRQIFFEKTLTGNAMVVGIVFEQPFWRQNGYSGKITFCSQNSIYNEVFDSTSPCMGGQGVLSVFIISEHIQRYMNEGLEKRKEKLLSTLAQFFGSQAETSCLHYCQYSFQNNPFVNSFQGQVNPPGVWSTIHSSFTKPLNEQIFWVGAEYASIWTNFFEGAFIMAEKAVSQIFPDRSKVSQTSSTMFQ